MGEHVADGEAIFSETDGWRQDVSKLHGAISFQSQSETGDSSRDSDRLVTDDGGFFLELAVFSDVHIAGGLTWSHFAIIEEGGFAVGQANQHESAAADVARGRLDHGKRESHSHRRIHRVTAALKDFDSRLRAKFLISCDHAMAGANSLGRPTLGVVGAVAEFGSSLAAHRRRPANKQNTPAPRSS